MKSETTIRVVTMAAAMAVTAIFVSPTLSQDFGCQNGLGHYGMNGFGYRIGDHHVDADYGEVQYRPWIDEEYFCPCAGRDS